MPFHEYDNVFYWNKSINSNDSGKYSLTIRWQCVYLEQKLPFRHKIRKPCSTHTLITSINNYDFFKKTDSMLWLKKKIYKISNNFQKNCVGFSSSFEIKKQFFIARIEINLVFFKNVKKNLLQKLELIINVIGREKNYIWIDPFENLTSLPESDVDGWKTVFEMEIWLIRSLQIYVYI